MLTDFFLELHRSLKVQTWVCVCELLQTIVSLIQPEAKTCNRTRMRQKHRNLTRVFETCSPAVLPVFSVSRCSSCFSQMLSRSCRAEQETVTIRFINNHHQVCCTNCEGNQSEPVVLFSPSVSLDSTEESWSNWAENTKHFRSNSCP